MDIRAIESIITSVLTDRGRRNSTRLWRGDALVGAADAKDPGFVGNKTAVSPSHRLPEDFLPGAATVLAWFIPFDPAVPRSNQAARWASRLWAEAYVETNRVLAEIGLAVEAALAAAGARGVTIGPPNHNYDKQRLLSDWSQRHVARLAGLGSFGLHNLLITRAGCAGRFGSLITDLYLAPSGRMAGEACLHKNGKSCARCVARCPSGALKTDGFDRRACFELLEENGRRQTGLGHVDACGKCAVGLPCTLRSPRA